MTVAFPYKDFTFYVDEDKIKVKFVTNRALGRTGNYQIGGDYTPGSKMIRLLRSEPKSSMRATFLHELCHYLVERNEMKIKNSNEEDICDLFSWLPMIFMDKRNTEFLNFLGLAVKKETQKDSTNPASRKRKR